MVLNNTLLFPNFYICADHFSVLVYKEIVKNLSKEIFVRCKPSYFIILKPIWPIYFLTLLFSQCFIFDVLLSPSTYLYHTQIYKAQPYHSFPLIKFSYKRMISRQEISIISYCRILHISNFAWKKCFKEELFPQNSENINKASVINLKAYCRSWAQSFKLVVFFVYPIKSLQESARETN